MKRDGRPRRTASARNAARLPRSRSAAKRPAKPPARSAERAAWRRPAARRPARGPESRGHSASGRVPCSSASRRARSPRRPGSERRRWAPRTRSQPLARPSAAGLPSSRSCRREASGAVTTSARAAFRARARRSAFHVAAAATRPRAQRKGRALPLHRDTPGSDRHEGEELEEVLGEEPEAVPPGPGGGRIGLGPQAVVQAVHVEEAGAARVDDGRDEPRAGDAPAHPLGAAVPAARDRLPALETHLDLDGPRDLAEALDDDRRLEGPGRFRRGAVRAPGSFADVAGRRRDAARGGPGDGVVDRARRGPAAFDEVARLGARHLAEDAEEVARRRVAEGEAARVLPDGGEEGLLPARPRHRLEEERRAGVGVRPSRRRRRETARSRGGPDRSARRWPGRARPATPPRGAAASGSAGESGRRTPPGRGSGSRRSSSRPSRRSSSPGPRPGAPRSSRRRRASRGTTGARARAASPRPARLPRRGRARSSRR